MTAKKSSVLITGAGRGFGLELLKVFSERKWKVFPLVRDSEVAETLIEQYAPDCHPIVTDVTLESVEKEISSILGKHTGSLDLLINNAGNIRKKRGLRHATSEELIDHFKVHCLGVLNCTKGALPFLEKAPKPSIVNITSRWGSIGLTVGGQGGFSGMVYAYKIAKAAQNMLTACLYHGLKDENIGVYAVHPGRLKTSVAPPDADIDPRDAAVRLYDWITWDDIDRNCRLYDLMNDSTIEW
jgi:NAD(P)-dependent dehydrogenase (short-subunit alcohol dehydrogenase family)